MMMGNALLEALGYIGDLLSKPGRSVRGPATGRWDELAAILPFSDTMGLTDPERQVSGRGLLEHYGMDKDAGLGGDIAGFGAQIATDPLSYLGAIGGGVGGYKIGKALAARRALPAAAEAAAPAALAETASPLAKALQLAPEAETAPAGLATLLKGNQAEEAAVSPLAKALQLAPEPPPMLPAGRVAASMPAPAAEAPPLAAPAVAPAVPAPPIQFAAKPTVDEAVMSFNKLMAGIGSDTTGAHIDGLAASLKTMSKADMEKVLESLNIAGRPRTKDEAARWIKQVLNTHLEQYVKGDFFRQ